MKRTLATLSLFFALALAFSSQNGCGSANQANSNNGSGAVNSNSSAIANTGDANKASQYPPISTALADAEFELLDGSKIKLSEKKGKVVLVTLWGTWCGPCVAEMPTLIALQDQYRDKGFEVLGLNIGDGSGTAEPVDLITKFVDQKKLNYTIARSSNQATKEFYKVTKQDVVPQGLLIDREGRLRGEFIGGGPRISVLMQDTIAKVMAE
jgi:thiol-disulfide isomerase/thioredoxin